MAARQKSRHGKGSSRKKKRVPPYGDKPRTSSKLTGSAKKPFKFLDHPADVGLVARGRTLEETFAAAAQALCEFGWELRNVRPRRQMEIRARAASLEDLLCSWLSEILFLTDVEQWVFRRFQVKSIRREEVEEFTAETQRTQRKASDPAAGAAGLSAEERRTPFDSTKSESQPTESQGAWEIQATAQGEKFNPARHRSRTYIKAVTYHQLSVKKIRTGWQATVFLDV